MKRIVMANSIEKSCMLIISYLQIQQLVFFESCSRPISAAQAGKLLFFKMYNCPSPQYIHILHQYFSNESWSWKFMLKHWIFPWIVGIVGCTDVNCLWSSGNQTTSPGTLCQSNKFWFITRSATFLAAAAVWLLTSQCDNPAKDLGRLFGDLPPPPGFEPSS